MLNTCASGVLICSTVTTNCPNNSPLGPLNFVSGTGNELVSSLVNTELKCKFNSSALKKVLCYYIVYILSF